VLVEASLPKFAAQSIRKVYDICWKPLHIVSFPAASIPLTLQPAGLDKSVGLVTAAFLKEPGDPTWKDDPEVAEYVAFLKKYSPEADPNDWANVIAYYHAAAVVHLLTITRRSNKCSCAASPARVGSASVGSSTASRHSGSSSVRYLSDHGIGDARPAWPRPSDDRDPPTHSTVTPWDILRISGTLNLVNTRRELS